MLNCSFLESFLEINSLTILQISTIKWFRRLLCIVDIIFVFKRFNAAKLLSEIAFVAGATKINFIDLKPSAKIGCFDADNALKELTDSDKNKFEPLRNSGRSFNWACKL